MAFDNISLEASHSLVHLNVSSAHQISNRTSAIISRLNPSEKSSDDQKTVIVALTAKAKAAGKLISIVEIAKRELAKDGVQCFQYTSLSSELVDIQRNPKGSKDGDVGEDESDDAFETMGQVKESATKKRSMPVLTIYLSTTSVKELKVALGHDREGNVPVDIRQIPINVRSARLLRSITISSNESASAPLKAVSEKPLKTLDISDMVYYVWPTAKLKRRVLPQARVQSV